jgi:hypothetical protein
MYTLVTLQIVTSDFKWIANPPNTVVVQLGDQIDGLDRTGRCDEEEEAWDKGKLDLSVMFTMEKLDTCAIEAGGGGRVLSIIGNHELLNVVHEFAYVSKTSLQITGVHERKRMFARGHMDYMDYMNPNEGICTQILARRNVILKVGPYVFCHAGLLIEHLQVLQDHNIGDVNYMNTLMRRFLLGEPFEPRDAHIFNAVIASDKGILWNRLYANLLVDADAHANSKCAIQEGLESVLRATNSSCMFVGHNVVNNITSAANNGIFFADAGLSRAFAYNRIQVLEILSTPNGDTVNIVEIKWDK